MDSDIRKADIAKIWMDSSISEHSDIEKSRLRDYKNLGELRWRRREKSESQHCRAELKSAAAEIESGFGFEHYWKDRYCDCGTFWKVIEVELR